MGLKLTQARDYRNIGKDVDLGQLFSDRDDPTIQPKVAAATYIGCSAISEPTSFRLFFLLFLCLSFLL